jgi:uncharacterized protein YbaR (Trm112 family)
VKTRLLDIVRCLACRSRLQLESALEERQPLARAEDAMRCVGGVEAQ